MSSRYDHRMMFKGLKKYIAQGMDFFKAARKAGYSDSTIKIKGDRLKRRAGLLPERPPKAGQGLVYVQEWSPVSGLPLPPHPPTEEVKPEAKPAEKPFVPEKFEHPALGEGRRSASGGFLPLWASDEYSGGSINLGHLPLPGDAERQSVWARFDADQARFARSYQTNRDTPPPPPTIYHAETEELPGRGFKNEGRDVSAEALDGRFGFARVPIWGE